MNTRIAPAQISPYLADTHEVSNLSRELCDYNMYTEDAALTEAVRREGGQWAEHELTEFLQQLALDEGVNITARTLARFEPVAFDERVIALVESTATGLGNTVRRLPSGAGHDAQMFARMCPTAMIFTQSHLGISHNPAEYTNPADLVMGADILLQVMLALSEHRF